MTILRLSPSGTEAAVIHGGDARLVVHALSQEVASPPRQYVERSSLDERYACVAWSTSGGLIGVCLASGGVAVWDVKRGVKVGSAGRPDAWSPGAVASTMAWGKEDEVLLAGSAKEPWLGRWSTSEACKALKAVKADKRGVTALATRPTGGAIACGSTRLRLVKLGAGADDLFPEEKKRRSFKGATTATPVRALAWSADGRFVAMAAERAVLVVDCSSTLPIAACGLESSVAGTVAVRCVGKRTLKLDAAVTCDDGCARVCRCVVLDGADQWTMSPSIFAARSSSLRAVDLAFRDSQLVVAHVDKAARPSASLVEYQAGPDLMEAVDIDDRGHRVSSKERARAPAEKPDVVPALESLPPLPGFGKKRPREEDDDERALADRLADLEAETAAREEEGALAEATPKSPSDARSLATALAQALRSSDDAMLEDVLQHADDDVRDATIDRLDAASALPFLAALVHRLEKKPARALHLATWTNLLLLRHGTFLAKQRDFPGHLAKLDVLLQKRAAALPLFVALAGRLELALDRSAINDHRANYQPRARLVAGDEPSALVVDRAARDSALPGEIDSDAGEDGEDHAVDGKDDGHVENQED